VTRHAVCLRCDWEGETRAHACPNCGVRLYRRVTANRAAPWSSRLRERLSRPTEPVTIDTPIVARAPRSPRGTRPESSSEGRSGRRGAGVALVALAVLLAGISVWFVQRHTPAPGPPHTGEVGSIIYEARSTDGQTRLYRWDLFANTVSRGPVVHDLIGLFDASGAHPGWVGETSGSATGGVDIGVFKFTGPDDQALPLGHGDVAAWAPQGTDALVGTARPASNGCASLYLLAIHLSPLRQDPTGGERVCASLESVQLSQRVTYLSLRGPKGSRVAFVSVGRLRTLLNHYRMDGLSPANDMVVTPDMPSDTPSDTPSSSTPGSGAQTIGVPDRNAALFFRGPAGQSPTPYMSAGSPFVLDRVLAWDPGGTEALVLGFAGGRSGFFRLVAAPPTGPMQPAIYVGPAARDAEALYTGVGTRIVFSGGQFSRVFDGSSAPLAMPPGAPVPAGPMVWLSA